WAPLPETLNQPIHELGSARHIRRHNLHHRQPQAHRLTSNRHRRPRTVIRHINREHHARLVIKLSDWFALADAARLPRLHRDHTLVLDPIPDPQPLTLKRVIRHRRPLRRDRVLTDTDTKTRVSL